MPFDGYKYTKPEWRKEFEFSIREIEEETNLSKKQLEKVIEVFIKHKMLEE